MTPEQPARIDLAAAFRWAARLNLHEAIANHFSVALSDDGRQFLLNPNGSHFSRIRASDLLLLDIDKPETFAGDNAPDPTAWYLHAGLHQRLPQARCILHTHMPNTTALCCLKDFEFLMLDQNACRFYQRIAYDRNYSGMALEASEGERVEPALDHDVQANQAHAGHKTQPTPEPRIEPQSMQQGQTGCDGRHGRKGADVAHPADDERAGIGAEHEAREVGRHDQAGHQGRKPRRAGLRTDGREQQAGAHHQHADTAEQ